MNFHRAVVWSVLALALGLSAGAGEITYRVRKDVLHRIDPRVFGQFMERPSWGEIGPEGALVPGTNQLQPEVLRLLGQMQIPILRFPGGTDVDFLDWRDMVSNVPGRGAQRPVSTGHKGHKVTNRFGYDEFLKFSESVKAEPILVVNLRDGLLKKTPMGEYVQHVAGLVAYCNAPVGAKLPAGMADWPAVRAKSGRSEPYGVKYWQIGNETWAFLADLKKLVPEQTDAYHAECIVAVAQAMLAVDPNIRFILDGQGGTYKSAEIARRVLGDRVSQLVFHSYTPWTIKKVTRDNVDAPPGKLTAAEIWNAWVATPDIDDRGLAVLRDGLLAKAREGGFKVAVTEWNWNGLWDRSIRDQIALSSTFAKGVGAAGFLHALMRSADVIEIGCQSMLVGNSWGIHAVRADAQGREAPRYMPSGQATMLYSLHHGENLLAMESSGVPTYSQPYRMGGLAPRRKVAVLDALATGGPKAVFFHVINRSFDVPMEVQVDLSDLAPMGTTARHYILQGRIADQPAPGQSAQIAEVIDSPVTFDGKTLKLTLPARSVTCVEIPRRE
jgi:alpha-N-arabinofuranosidase